MAYSLNKVQLIGNVGKDPELSYSTTGTAYSRFSLATTDRVKDKSGEWQNKTEWHNITIFGKTAETFSKLIKKGSKIFIEGKLTNSEYEKDGVKRNSYSILVSDMRDIVLLDKREGGGSGGSSESSTGSSESGPVSEDDLPF
ncbi:MAG TPA: single-stranded DNA-binding protein [Ignavibacteria bacterium]|nr:single-stranded DNA-binding protein [Ignavibacteria bacterium]